VGPTADPVVGERDHSIAVLAFFLLFGTVERSEHDFHNRLSEAIKNKAGSLALPERELAMSNGSIRLHCAAWIAVLLFASLAQSEAKDRKNDKGKVDRARLLTRSIYLPVELEVCEHLRQAVLYQGDQAVSLLPAKRIFQFTYYPTLDRIEPLRSDIRVEGKRNDGTEFLARLAVTAWGVFTADHKIKLDLDSQLRKMRYKLDVRYEPLVIRISCSDACERKLAAATVTADEATQPEN
jgi:hypothetical protein